LQYLYVLVYSCILWNYNTCKCSTQDFSILNKISVVWNLKPVETMTVR
jgi:hypothetical protein